MKKLILTSPAFKGEVELLYGVDNRLALVDMQNAELEDIQIKQVKAFAPVVYNSITEVREAFKSATLRITEAYFEVTFEMFYNSYGKKRNRDRCEKHWERMTKAQRFQAYIGVRPYLKHLSDNKWKSQLDPENYLKKEEWLNDYK